MRTMIFVALAAVLCLPAFSADATPTQYATGTQWETSLAGAPEVDLMGATSIASYGGNIYLLQGNTLRKLTLDLKEVASVPLPDLPLALASLDQSRGAISCGMHGPDLSGRMSTAMSPLSASTQATASLQQAADQNMAQGLHQAHSVTSLGDTQVAADQHGVYVLRGGRLTVFDHNLKEQRSQAVVSETTSAADCPTCQAALSNGALMDQVRFRGMQTGLCPGPGQYAGTVYYGDTSRDRMANRPLNRTLCPACGQAEPAQASVMPEVAQPIQPVVPEPEVPVSMRTTTPAPEETVAPETYAGPTTYVAPATGTNYGTASAGSDQQWQAQQQAVRGKPGHLPTGGVGMTSATTPTTIGARHEGTAGAATGVRADQGPGGTTQSYAERPGTATSATSLRATQGAWGTTPTTTGTQRAGTAVAASATRTIPSVSSEGGYVGGSTGGYGGGAPQPAGPEQGVIIGTSFETSRPSTYGWMYTLPGVTGGELVPVSTRNVVNGSVLLGVSGSSAGPQFLHVHVLQPSGYADPNAGISAYLYDRGYVNEGRSLNLIRHAGGEYMIRFDPSQLHGDTLAVRITRPMMADQVVYFSLAGSEITPQ